MADNLTEEIEFDGLFLSIDTTLPNKITVNVKGRLETANSIHFLNFMTELINSSVTGVDLILAMADLYYVSSTGIGAFTTILVNTKKKNIQLYFKDMQPKVLSVLELLGFTAFFKFI
ncbi:MAG: STAS domain-containing protein [Spirochaetia bacterium]|jgi:anti-sigma B factor antagonist|nr:STAS domain-containing protein [Spirochaetia bacterium]